jgi:1-acyl-sn-glycerol-3-phosphate acyltransferase
MPALRLGSIGVTLVGKFLTNAKGVAALAVITVDTFIWFTPIMLLTLLKLIIPQHSFRRIMTRWIMAMGENWVSFNAIIFGLVNNVDWEIRGVDRLDKKHWYMVFANHQTWVDIVVLQTVFNRRIPFLKFFLKQQLIWFPLLGLAFWAMDMPFMKRHSKSYLAKHPEKKGSDLVATRRACEKFRHTPTTVINFLEGTRFSDAKRRKRNSPFNYLLAPRAGGVAVALAAMGDMFDAILDVTIIYPDGVPRFWDMMCGKMTRVVVDVVTLPVEPWCAGGDYANDREFRQRFHRWLSEVWQLKDQRIAALREEFGVTAVGEAA